jgi:hypothetical protein
MIGDTDRKCLAAVQENGVMTALANRKGGNNGSAYWANDLGEVAGFAEIGIVDSTCANGPLIKSSSLKYRKIKIWCSA